MSLCLNLFIFVEFICNCFMCSLGVNYKFTYKLMCKFTVKKVFKYKIKIEFFWVLASSRPLSHEGNALVFYLHVSKWVKFVSLVINNKNIFRKLLTCSPELFSGEKFTVTVKNLLSTPKYFFLDVRQPCTCLSKT